MNKIAAITLLTACLTTAHAAPGDNEPLFNSNTPYGAGPLDERVAKLEKKLAGDSQLELVNRIEQLQQDVLRLRGEVEDLSHQLETSKRQQKDMYLDLDRRLQALATPPPAPVAAASDAPPTEAPAPVVTPPPVAAPVPVPAPIPTPAPAPAPVITPPPPAAPVEAPKPPAAPSADSAARQAAYQKGFAVLKDGKYIEAIKEFKNFLAQYPKGEYSDNAAYWMAEAYYVNRNLAAAREAFRKVVQEYPQAVKAADAQLKLGYIDYENSQWTAAKENLLETLRRYPDSSAAKLAQKRLEKMKQEGH